MFQKDDNGILTESPIHCWFGLTYSSYYTVPRMALEAMPLDWQTRFVALMDEFEDIGIETPTYYVLRDDEKYTRKEMYNDDELNEPNGPIQSLHLINDDPWAEYRYPDVTLLPVAMKGDIDWKSA